MKVSIVTVVFNSVSVIEETILSVIDMVFTTDYYSIFYR